MSQRDFRPIRAERIPLLGIRGYIPAQSRAAQANHKKIAIAIMNILKSGIILNLIKHADNKMKLGTNSLNSHSSDRLERLTLLREIYRALINSGRTYAAFEDKKVYPLVEKLSEREEIFDPMSGYGSLIGYCARLGISSYCIEYNLPQFLWQVLIHPRYSTTIIDAAEELICRKNDWPKTSFMASVQDDWFPDDSKAIFLKLYEILFGIINKLTKKNRMCEEMSLALLLPFIGRLSCSVPADISTHTKKGGLCVYAGWENDFEEYLNSIVSNLRDIKNMAKSTKHTITLGDCRTAVLPKERFSALITSPPYPNNRDFTSIFIPENELLRWLYSKKHISVKTIDNPIIGSNFVSGRVMPRVKSKSALNFLRKIEDFKETKRAQYDNKVYYIPYFSLYFAGLEDAYLNVAKALQKDFEGYVIVVNNTARNIVIPVEKCIIEIWRGLGFKAEIANAEETFHVGTKNPRARGLKAKHTEYTIRIWRR